MKSENLDRANERREPEAYQRTAVVRLQRVTNSDQIREERSGIGIRFAGRNGVAQGLGVGKALQRRGEPAVDAGQGAAVRLVDTMRTVIDRPRRQLEQRGGTWRERPRHGELCPQQVGLGQVMAQRYLGVAPDRHDERRCNHVWIAVAITADPIAHAEEGRHGPPELVFQVRVEARNLGEKGRGVVAQHVLDFVSNGQPLGAQYSCLPKLGYASSQPRLVVGNFAGAAQVLARGQQIGNVPFGVQSALALYLGWMRGQHRRHEAPVQGSLDPFDWDAGLPQTGKAFCQAAVLRLVSDFVD